LLVQCIRTFFEKKFHYVSLLYPIFSKSGPGSVSIDVGNVRLDELANASGFNKNLQAELERFQRDVIEEEARGEKGFNEEEPGEESAEEGTEEGVLEELGELEIQEAEEVPVLADVCCCWR
jgi:hypothetical protein